MDEHQDRSDCVSVDVPQNKENVDGGGNVFNDFIQQANSVLNSSRFFSKSLPLADSDQNERLICALEGLVEQFKRYNDLEYTKFIEGEEEKECEYQEEEAAIREDRENFKKIRYALYG